MISHAPRASAVFSVLLLLTGSGFEGGDLGGFTPFPWTPPDLPGSSLSLRSSSLSLCFQGRVLTFPHPTFSPHCWFLKTFMIP